MGTGHRMFLQLFSRIVRFIDIIRTFVNGFMANGPIGWNASEEYKAISVFFAWSFCGTVA